MLQLLHSKHTNNARLLGHPVDLLNIPKSYLQVKCLAKIGLKACSFKASFSLLIRQRQVEYLFEAIYLNTFLMVQKAEKKFFKNEMYRTE